MTSQVIYAREHVVEFALETGLKLQQAHSFLDGFFLPGLKKNRGESLAAENPPMVETLLGSNEFDVTV